MVQTVISQMSANDDFGFQQGDFTIEFWLYAQSVTGTQTLFDMRAGIANDNPHMFLDGTTVKYSTAGTKDKWRCCNIKHMASYCCK